VREDGVVEGLTDAGVAFVMAGVTYRPANGVTLSATTAFATTTQGTAQATSIEAALGGLISNGDLIAGKYLDARVWVYEVDYLDPGAGPMIVSQFVITKVTLQDVQKQVQLEELPFRLKMATGRTLASTCDVEDAWNLRCDPTGTLLPAFSHPLEVVAVGSEYSLDFGTDNHPDDYFTFGKLTWTSGDNAGVSGDIKVHTHPAVGVARVTLRVAFGYVPQVGDEATLVRGCSRQPAFCKTVVNAANPSGFNFENYQGFDLPVPDQLHYVGRQKRN